MRSLALQSVLGCLEGQGACEPVDMGLTHLHDAMHEPDPMWVARRREHGRSRRGSTAEGSGRAARRGAAEGGVRRGAPPRSVAHPAQRHRSSSERARPVSTRRRVLLRLPMRPESTGRVPARRPGIRACLRLRAGQGRVVRGGTARGGNAAGRGPCRSPSRPRARDVRAPANLGPGS